MPGLAIVVNHDLAYAGGPHRVLAVLGWAMRKSPVAISLVERLLKLHFTASKDQASLFCKPT